jgi:hypothetical protein
VIAGAGLLITGRAETCDLWIVARTGGAAYPLMIQPLIPVPARSAIGENIQDRFGYSPVRRGMSTAAPTAVVARKSRYKGCRATQDKEEAAR